MAVYAMADLHLAKANPEKDMGVFDGWKDYKERIEANWKKLLKPDDLMVIPGDISWSMSLEGALDDLKFIDNLPGQKVLLRGNHDYWWTTTTKLRNFTQNNNLSSIHFVFNDCYETENGCAVCGTRGWVKMQGEEVDNEKIQKREAGRLELSLKSALDRNLKPLVFLHYPPIYNSYKNNYILEILEKYSVKRVWYGHVHGLQGHRNAFQEEYNGTRFTLISGDFLQFFPYRIL